MLTKLLKIIVVLITITFFNSNAYGESDNDLKLKALFLYNFANFVEWPSTAFKQNTSPIEMCLFGEVPFGRFMNAIDGTLIGDRELKIRHNKNINEIKNGCQMLFVGNDKQHELENIYANKKHLYVLSVGENDQFIEDGGTINIMRNQDTFTFDINLNSARKNGLFISSDLLVLARKIKGFNE